ncbi:MAG: hypothetical protein ACOYXC_13730 [Candidatus Rifleibacteriota bacterium]
MSAFSPAVQAQTAAGGSGWASGGKWVAGSLAAGVVGGIGNMALGYALNEIGLGDSSHADTIKLLEKISIQVQDLDKQIKQLDLSLKILENDTLAAQIDELASVILLTHDRVAGMANDLIADNKELEEETKFAPPEEVEKKKKELDEKYKRTRKDCMETIRTVLLPKQNVIHDMLVGKRLAGGGLIERWSKVCVGRRRFFSLADSKAQEAMFNYWDTVQVVQLKLIVDYLHATDASKSTVNRTIETYNKNREEQLKLLLPPVPEWCLVCRPRDKSSKRLMIRGNYLVNPYNQVTYERAVTVLKEINAKPHWGNGFNDWRLPDYDGWKSLGWGSKDMKIMFDEEENGDYLNEAWNDGWPKEWLKPGATFWVNNDFRKRDPMLSSRVSCWSFDAYGGGYIHDRKHDFVASCMPVRDLKTGEKYFYD